MRFPNEAELEALRERYPAGTRIRLIRMDNGVPVAYSHSDLPGSVDHTKVPFILLSAEKYATTRTIVPSI